MDSFGNRLWHARQMRRIAQVDIANKLKLTQPAISHFEQGRRKPTMEDLISLSRLLDVPLGWLALGVGPQPPGLLDWRTDPYRKPIRRSRR